MASNSQQAPRAATSTLTTMGSGFDRYVQAVGGQLQIIAVFGEACSSCAALNTPAA